jgi:hypothetical protein
MGDQPNVLTKDNSLVRALGGGCAGGGAQPLRCRCGCPDPPALTVRDGRARRLPKSGSSREDASAGLREIGAIFWQTASTRREQLPDIAAESTFIEPRRSENSSTS